MSGEGGHHQYVILVKDWFFIPKSFWSILEGGQFDVSLGGSTLWFHRPRSSFKLPSSVCRGSFDHHGNSPSFGLWPYGPVGPFLWENPYTPDKLPLLSGVSLSERNDFCYVKVSAYCKRWYFGFLVVSFLRGCTVCLSRKGSYWDLEPGDVIPVRETTQAREVSPSALELKYWEWTLMACPGRKESGLETRK